MLQDSKMLKKPLGAFGDWSHSNILMRFVVIVVGKRCFIQIKTSCSEIVPLITFPWESFQSFWGQFISRGGSKWEPWSSQSENRCFNGNNNNKKIHFGETFEKFDSCSTLEWKHNSDLRNLCERALLISGCLSQKLHGLSEKGMARRSFAGPATPWPPTPCLDFWWEYHPSSAALCSPSPSAQKPLAMQKNCLMFCLAFLHLLKCAKWFTKNKKSSFGPRSSHLGEMQHCGSMGNEILSPNKTTE